jgi:DNA-directed RNA polymerase sigma subunit (sigma70/sigma32)
MQPVSSVTAFLARHVSRPTVDAEAQEMLALLDPIERRVAEELARTPQREDRLRRLAEQTGMPSEPARYDRIEARALRHLNQELTRRGWLQP